MLVIQGTVKSGYGVAGKNLIGLHPVIESRTGLRGLVEGTLNVAIESPYYVTPIAKVTRAEYREELLFQRCRVRGVRCLIMRPETHERGAEHGASCLEIMSDRCLRTSMDLTDGSVVAVEVEGDDNWWNANAT